MVGSSFRLLIRCVRAKDKGIGVSSNHRIGNSILDDNSKPVKGVTECGGAMEEYFDIGQPKGNATINRS